jgi:hypothetical protein
MTTDSEAILCRTTRWYFKRRIIMVTLLLGLSAYFCYDWKIGYPKQKVEYDAYWPVYWEMSGKIKQDKTVGEQEKAAAEKAWRVKAQDNGWKAEPKETDWDYKLKEQLIWAIGTGLIGLGMLAAFLRNKNRVLSADADSLTSPDGIRIPFASVRKIDKRKWDGPALAFLWYENEAGATKKAVIDDLAFDGAGKVLDRLMANFHGELIDIVRAAPEADAAAAAPAETPPQG